jgi:hypothetical protein
VKDGLSPESRFLSLFKNMPNETIVGIYKKKGVHNELVEDYSTFLRKLINTVYDTFLGNDIIYQERDIIAHFGWCFNTAAEETNLGKYKYTENKELYDYFLEYFTLNLYLCEESREVDFQYFSFFLNYLENKQKVDVDGFVDLYDIFERTPKNGRKLKPKARRLTYR